MTNLPRDPPDDEETFRAELQQLVVAAAANGVQVDRAWECRTDNSEVPDWEIEIVRLALDGRDDNADRDRDTQ